MLVDFQLDVVALWPGVVPPYIALPEPDAIEHALGLAAKAVGELLGVGKSAADALDDAALAADVVRRAPMAGRVRVLHRHAIADVVAPSRGFGVRARQTHRGGAPRPSSRRARLQ